MGTDLILPNSSLQFRAGLCDQPRAVAVLHGGVVTGFRVPCRLRRCQGCGDVRLNRATVGVWTAALLGEMICEGRIENEDRQATQKRIGRRGYQVRVFPQQGNLSVIFTTDPREGSLVLPPDLPLRLVLAWQNMVRAGGRCGGSRRWATPSMTRAASPDRQFLGITTFSIEQQAAALRELLGDHYSIVCVDDRWSLRLPDDLAITDVIERLKLTKPRKHPR